MSFTSVIRYVRALDTSSSTGAGKTGLAFGDITAKYLTKGGTLTSLTTETITTLGTYQAPTSAAHIRIKELSSSDPCKGVYEVHFHDTQVAAAGVELWLFLSAAGAFQPYELQLSDYRLPDASPGATGGVAIVGSAMALTSGAVQAIWDAATSALTTPGSIGKRIVDYLGGGSKVAATVATGDGADAATLLTRITAARAGYWDNLNVGGAVASHADILAINQSASKHVLLQTVGQYERPESGSTVYTVEARTFTAADGAAVNADSTPTLTATGQTSGSLAANLSAATNPATGVYRWTYTVANNATSEPIRFDISATISSSTFTLSCYSQVVDEVSATWTSTNASNLTAIFNKLPSKTYLAGSNNSDGDVQLDEATGTLARVALVDITTDLTNLPAAAATATSQTTILNRLGAIAGTGVNTVLGFFKALMKRDATNPSDIGGTFDAATDALEAQRELAEATIWTDKTTTPWSIVFIRKGTGNLGAGVELLRRSLYDVNGGNLVSTDTVVGRELSA